MKKLFALMVAATFLVGASVADAQKNKEKKPAKMTEVTVCPMTGEAVKGEGGGKTVVGKYNVHFCCAGCKTPFDKLSKAEQQKKIEEALKKQNDGKKKQNDGKKKS